MLEKWSDSQEKGEVRREGGRVKQGRERARDRDIVQHKGTEQTQRRRDRQREKKRARKRKTSRK